MRVYLILIVAFGIVASMLGGKDGPPPSPASTTTPRVIELAPQRPERSAASLDLPHGALELKREYDGHFYADVEINGQQINMLVDTGASDIALSREDARRAGLAISSGMFEVVGQGASGDVRGEPVVLDRVSLGSATSQQVQAVVLDSSEKSLLGQSFLRNFASVQIEGDRMILR